MDAKGEVRKNKVVEGVGKWAEARALSSPHSEEPERKAKEDWSEEQGQGLGERMKWERPPRGMHTEDLIQGQNKAAPVFPGPLSVSLSRLFGECPFPPGERP